MKKNNIILYASIAGVAYLAYWYVTTYGPAGEVKVHGGPSYWDWWFGGAPVQAAAAVPPQQLQPNGTPFPSVYQQPAPQPAQVTAKPPVQAPAQLPGPVAGSAPPVNMFSASARTILLSLTGGANSLNADQWNYYFAQAMPGAPTPDLFTPNNRGEAIDVDTYLSRRAAAGLSGYGMGDIVPVPSIPSIPSMSFGGSLRGGPGSWGQGNRGRGGGYIQ